MIEIIEHRESDEESLYNLFSKLRKAVYNDASSSKSDFLRETEGEEILVALCDKDIVGFVSVWVADNFVHHLYVEEKYQNRKIGTLLLRSVIAKTGIPLRLKCVEANTKAIEFYRKKGFIEKGRGQTESGPYILFELQKLI